jgi:hypothetical protein
VGPAKRTLDIVTPTVCQPGFHGWLALWVAANACCFTQYRMGAPEERDWSLHLAHVHAQLQQLGEQCVMVGSGTKAPRTSGTIMIPRTHDPGLTTKNWVTFTA